MSPEISAEFKWVVARICRAEAQIANLSGDFDLEVVKIASAEALEKQAEALELEGLIRAREEMTE